MQRGKLIIIEGADGAGKGTQFEVLKKVLEFNKVKFETFDFPRYDKFWGQSVADFLNTKYGDVSKISPYLKVLPYLLDQADASSDINNFLNEGKLVLCNRYATSNHMYQPAWMNTEDEKNKFLEWFDQAAFDELNIVKPDLVIGFYADPEVAFENIEKKTKRNYTDQKRDANEKNFDLQKKVTLQIDKLVDRYDFWNKIIVTENKEMKTIENIANSVVDLINEKLGLDLDFMNNL